MSPALGDDPLRQSLFKKTQPAVPQPEMETAVARSTAVSEALVVPDRRSARNILGFRLGDRVFGADISQIDTVVRMVFVSPVPMAPSFVEGIINVRGRIVPVVSLGRLFNLRPAKPIVSRRIIVGSSGSEQIALIVDSVSGIIAIAPGQVSSPSASMPMASICGGVAKLDQPEGELMMILDFDKLLSLEQRSLLESGVDLAESADELGKAWTRGDVPLEEAEESSAVKVLRHRSELLSLPVVREEKQTRNILTFSLGREVYGLDMTTVCRILRGREFTQLPCAPKYVLGVVNFEGQITPLVDIKGVLGIMEAAVRGAGGRILVAEHRGAVLAFIADEVFDVMEIDTDAIEAPLSTIEKVKADFIDGEARVGQRLVIILNWRNIMSSGEIGKAAEAAARA